MFTVPVEGENGGVLLQADVDFDEKGFDGTGEAESDMDHAGIQLTSDCHIFNPHYPSDTD